MVVTHGWGGRQRALALRSFVARHDAADAIFSTSGIRPYVLHLSIQGSPSPLKTGAPPLHWGPVFLHLVVQYVQGVIETETVVFLVSLYRSQQIP